jgi:hypothetical protein
MNRVKRIITKAALLTLLALSLNGCTYQSASGDTKIEGGGTITAGAAF